MFDKKLLLIVCGVGDTMLADDSFRKLKNNQEVRSKVISALEYFNQLDRPKGYINLNYSSDTYNHVNVFKDISPTKVVEVRLNARSMVDKNNEMVIPTLDKETLLFNGDQIDYIFRPSEYEVVLFGVDLHGMMVDAIKDLLAKGYKVKLLKDSLSTFPNAMKEIKTLFKEENFDFCSYRSIV